MPLQLAKHTFCSHMVLRFFLLKSIIFPVLITSQTFPGLEKPGRCASVIGKCSGSSPSSRCFFHFECPGNQLCCSIDGCINACTDPIQNSSSLSITDLLSQSDKLLSSADSGYYFSTAQKGPYFKCRAGLLIKTSYRCNGNNDCPDGDNSDEMDCPCDFDEAPCTNGLCVKLSSICLPAGAARNVNAPCSVQNLNCSSVSCPGIGHFRCSNGQCIPLSSRCDGTFSCLDGSDEQDCGL